MNSDKNKLENQNISFHNKIELSEYINPNENNQELFKLELIQNADNLFDLNEDDPN